MEEENVNNLVQATETSFPKTLQLPDGQVLQRQVIAIDSKENRVDTTNGCLSHYNSPDATEHVLWQLLEILDHNLGPTYTRASRALYHNKRPWRVNKWGEMLTRGLVYVVYTSMTDASAPCGNGRELPTRRSARRTARPAEPLLFLSFMFTQEDGLAWCDPARVWAVLYLYEIQLLPRVRSCGLGKRLVSELLVRAACQVRDATRLSTEQFFGIELTVFGENDAAVRFYRRLGMRRAADSPTDDDHGGDVTPQQHQHQRHRPLYYLYTMRIGNVVP